MLDARGPGPCDHLIVFHASLRQTLLYTDCRPALQKNWDTDLHFKADFSCGTSGVNRTNPTAIERTLSGCTSTTTLWLLASGRVTTSRRFSANPNELWICYFPSPELALFEVFPNRKLEFILSVTHWRLDITLYLVSNKIFVSFLFMEQQGLH